VVSTNDTWNNFSTVLVSSALLIGGRVLKRSERSALRVSIAPAPPVACCTLPFLAWFRLPILSAVSAEWRVRLQTRCAYIYPLLGRTITFPRLLADAAVHQKLALRPAGSGVP
jgi:hypothetical protein